MRLFRKRIVIGLSVLALAQLGVLAAGSGLANAAPVHNPDQIVNVHSGLCLVPKGDVIKVGTPIVQVTCSTDRMQEWFYYDSAGNPQAYLSAPNGHYGAVEQYTPGYCIGAAGGTFRSGTAAVLSTSCRYADLDGNFDLAYIKDDATGLCLDISGASLSQNAPLIWYTCHGTTNQQWWNPDIF